MHVKNYFLASHVFAQHAFLQSAPHFLASAFLPLVHAEHSAFFSAFLAEQPHPSQAKTEEPAMNNAIAAILIILFIVGAPIVN